jgi:hypothetical protein
MALSFKENIMKKYILNMPLALILLVNVIFGCVNKQISDIYNKKIDVMLLSFINSGNKISGTPDAPSVLQAPTATSTQVNLSWKDNSDNETGFSIERSTDNVNYGQIDTALANATSYNNTGLVSDTTYYYRIRAYNSAGSSAYSNNASAATCTVITFETSGPTFSPVLKVTGSPVIQWTWADGTTDSSATPTKNYGTAAVRKNYLLVTPWSAVTRINIGYDGLDGGSSSIEHVLDQDVTSVSCLYLVAPYLQQWCSSYNKITSLEFSNFIMLDTIECYWSKTLQNVTLTNTPALKRACFEDCDLKALDLSQSPNLEDLRGAVNDYRTINFGTIGSKIRHICTRSNTQITNTSLFTDMSQFPYIVELYIWNDNQSGELRVSSTGTSSSADIQAWGNHYTSADFTGAFTNPSGLGNIEVQDNELTSLNITDCVELVRLIASNNNLDSNAVDSILITLDGFRRVRPVGDTSKYYTIDLTNNNPPTAASQAARDNLISNGWNLNLTP